MIKFKINIGTKICFRYKDDMKVLTIGEVREGWVTITLNEVNWQVAKKDLLPGERCGVIPGPTGYSTFNFVPIVFTGDYMVINKSEIPEGVTIEEIGRYEESVEPPLKLSLVDKIKYFWRNMNNED